MDIATTTVPVLSCCPGTVISWRAKVGQRVRRGDALGYIADAEDDNELAIITPCEGVVVWLAEKALDVQEGEAVATVEPLHYVTPTTPHVHQSTWAQGDVHLEPSNAHTPPVPRRELASPVTVQELTFEPPAPKPKKARKPRKESVTPSGYRILPSQKLFVETDVSNWSSPTAEQRLECNGSLIDRMLHDLYASMPEAKRRKLVEAYKLKEEAAGIGSARVGRPKAVNT